MKTLLAHRSVIRVSGNDANALLQGIITQDIGLLKSQPLIFSAMLSAQGKYAHDFFVWAKGDDRLIEIDTNHVDALMKKLKLYKLRAQVTMEDVSSEYAVLAAWGDDSHETNSWYPDPRLTALGQRALVPIAELPSNITSTPEAYDVHRLALGVPDGASDGTDRHFALELGYDQLNGVSFTKGCFVGQEPTARMHYRNVLRKGLFQVNNAAKQGALPEAGSAIVAGDLTLGELRSSHGGLGLAFCRMDPFERAQNERLNVTCQGVSLTMQIPDYMRPKWQRVQAAQSEAKSEA